MEDSRIWRYIPFRRYSPYLKTALNEVLMHYVSQTKQPIVWISGWDRDCINIGVSQNIYDVIDYEKLLQDKIAISRRQSGGGAMMLSRDGDITWNVIVPENMVSNNVNTCYKLLCNEIISELRKSGINAFFKPINDIVTSNGKLSGATLRKKEGVVYVAGTLLYKKNKQQMEKYLKPENDKLKNTSIKEKEKAITSIIEESNLDFDETIELLKRAFLRINPYEELEINKQELKKAEIFQRVYSTNNWIESAKNDNS